MRSLAPWAGAGAPVPGDVMIPWTAETCLERIGRESLYEPGEEEG